MAQCLLLIVHCSVKGLLYTPKVQFFFFAVAANSLWHPPHPQLPLPRFAVTVVYCNFSEEFTGHEKLLQICCVRQCLCVCVCVCSWWQWRRRLTRWPTTSPGRSTGSLMGGRPVRAGGLACRWDGWYGRCFKIDAPLKFVSNKLGPPLWPAKFWKIFFLPLK